MWHFRRASAEDFFEISRVCLEFQGLFVRVRVPICMSLSIDLCVVEGTRRRQPPAKPFSGRSSTSAAVASRRVTSHDRGRVGVTLGSTAMLRALITITARSSRSRAQTRAFGARAIARYRACGAITAIFPSSEGSEGRRRRDHE